MRELGLSHVRVAEFAWSRIEPRRGEFRWEWLDEAVGVLGEAGLRVVMCTPTATPPKWLVDERPDILPTGPDGRVRAFGSRRHYSFSSPGYREESRRITRAVAARYGGNPHVAAWQTDNEYGCHGTVRDYGPAARDAFREWLRAKHGDVDALNAAWGNVFWSMEYRSFSEVDVPSGAVTETNPAHRLDFARFSSDQVVAFDREQLAILRDLSPGRWTVHNVMGVSLDFDHFALGRNHDMLAWDSYPLGFLEQSAASEVHKLAYMRAGDPDFQAFHHDLYRNTAPAWGVMEQQNGPVNWAPHNPFPREGQVRLWTEEARAHGASLVSYFRWRQAPFAQEQNHSALLRVDGSLSAGGREVEALPAQEGVGEPLREVALVFSYDAQWMFETQPQGAGWSYWELVQRFYRAARRQGLNTDVVGPDADLSPYALALAPSLPVVDPQTFRGMPALFGPRTGSKTEHFRIPPEGPPGPLAELVPLRVHRWESLRPNAELALEWEGDTYPVTTWREEVETDAEVLATVEGRPALVRSGHASYLAVWPDETFLSRIVGRMAADAGLEPEQLPEGVRTRRTASGTFAANHGPEPVGWRGRTLLPGGTVWL